MLLTPFSVGRIALLSMLAAASSAWAVRAPAADPAEADLSDKGLTSVPGSVLRMNGLERLNLEGNALAELPKGIAKLKGLRSLNLSGNRLKSLPAQVGELKELEYLGLAGNPISSLPATLSGLEKLSILDLRGTGLTRVPEQALPLLQRGAAALVSSATFRGWFDEPFAALETRHVSRETRFGYSLSLGLPPLKLRNGGKREDFVYPPGEPVVVFDPELNYGAMGGPVPCYDGKLDPSSPLVAGMGDSPLRRFLDKNCPKRLYAHGPAGGQKLTRARLRSEKGDCCGHACLKVLAEHEKPPRKAAFLSTAPGPKGKNGYLRLARTLDAELPVWLRVFPPAAPSGFNKVWTGYYRYPGPDREAFLAYVRAEGVLLSEPTDDPVTATWGGWQGVYWVDRNGTRLLTPPSPAGQRAFGGSFEPAAAYDIDGNGALGVLLGDPVSLILERYGDGFRAWGFPPPRGGGCAESR